MNTSSPLEPDSPPVEVEDLEPFRVAQDRTRNIRLALEVIFDRIAWVPGCNADSTLLEVAEAVARAEDEELKDLGKTWHYLIIRPLSLTQLPPAGDLDKITVAVRTLCDHGLIINDR